MPAVLRAVAGELYNRRSEFTARRVPMSGQPTHHFGGIVLCGGKSTRMGRPKLALPFGPETMLERVVRILSREVEPIVVVAAEGQELPPLPDATFVVRDEYESLGPLAGLAVGLERLHSSIEAAYVTSCDVPLLKPEFIRAMISQLAEYDLAMPSDGKFHHPLAGVYRTSLAGTVRSLVDARRLRPVFLLDECRARVVDVTELRAVDPQLDSLRNTNTESEYHSALTDAGFTVPTSS